ncbi:MAG: hypothetical protein QXN24_01625 [Candidatus Bathyarchaeia archaeon]
MMKLLLVKDLESKISHLEELLQSISREILANVFYESAPPSKLLADSESYLNTLKNIAEEIKDILLILSPERTPSIKREFRGFMHPVNVFIKALKETEGTGVSSKDTLEHLKTAIRQGQGFLELAKDVAKNPSKSISEVLRLKEMSETKDYISRIYVPEAVYLRLEYFRRSLESFKAHVSSLERSARELLKYISKIEEEISKLQRQ